MLRPARARLHRARRSHASEGRAEVESTETIPIWHKIALRPIPKGGHVFKYGELIGEALRDIPRGAWVSHENIYSVPRDYASEYIGKKG